MERQLLSNSLSNNENYILHSVKTSISALLITLISSACSTQAPQPATPTRIDTIKQAQVQITPEVTASRTKPTALAAQKTPPKEHVVENLWQAIINDFELNASPNKRIESQRQWLKKRPRYLRSASKNARPYLHYISTQLTTHGLPAEFALLPIVESAYKPLAHSSGKAAGLWQFIPSTGKSMGLNQNWWYDGRLDVISSTRAAISYLSRLHRQFDNDWLLALAAYNAGEGTVRKAIRRNKRAGKSLDFWSLQLPKETKIYVPRLLAIASVLQEKNAITHYLTPISNTAFFNIVDIGSQLELARAAELAGITLAQVQQLNSGFKRWTTAPQGPHRLLLPVTTVNAFNETLAALAPEQRVRWAHYQVRSGDTLSQIAQRHHSSVAAIKQLNKLSSNRIRIKQNLLIPNAASGAAIKASQAYATAKSIVHRVRRGDSLWKIARRYSISINDLARANNISVKAVLRIGQKLRIYG